MKYQIAKLFPVNSDYWKLGLIFNKKMYNGLTISAMNVRMMSLFCILHVPKISHPSYKSKTHIIQPLPQLPLFSMGQPYLIFDQFEYIRTYQANLG